MNHISASGHQFFLFLHRFFKVEAVFPHSGHIYFNILYPACVNIFSAWCKKYFLVKAILLLIETIIFKERAYSC